MTAERGGHGSDTVMNVDKRAGVMAVADYVFDLSYSAAAKARVC